MLKYKAEYKTGHTQAVPRQQNLILSSLPDHEYNNIRPYFKEVSFNQGEVLDYSGTPSTNVYFLNKGVASFSVCNSDGISLELCMIGNEAVIGERVIFKHSRFIARCQMLTAGEGYKLDSQLFQKEFYQGGVLNELVLSQLESKLTETSQTALCNYTHIIEQRFSRWLLCFADRAQSERLHLTQEAISAILGTHRPSISVAAFALQDKGVISYKRGIITIVDRKRLEQESCECYGVIKETILGYRSLWTGK